MPSYEEYDTTTVDNVAQDFDGATVITDAANTTTTAQQTGRDSRRRTRGSTPTGRRNTRSSLGNLKSPNKYGN